MKKAFLLIFLSLIVCSLCASNHVVELTEENFDSVLRQGKPALVKFFTSWCGFCKKLEPEWNTLADVIHEGGDKVIIAKLDCDKYSDLARKYAVQGYPTIKFFPNGPINHEPYDSNDRDADSFIEFLNENAGIRQKYLKPRKVIDVPANRFTKVLNDNSRAVLVAFYDPKDPNCLALAPIYDDLGKIFEKDDVVFVRFNSETYEAREIKRNFKITRYPAAFFFPKGRLASDFEHAIRYENLLIKDEMIRFLKVQLNSEGSSGRIKALDELVVRLIKGDKEAIPEAERVSSSFTGDQLKFSEIYIKYMKHYDQKDKDFALKEIARVNKMLSNKNVVGGKVNEFLARLSILESFTQSN